MQVERDGASMRTHSCARVCVCAYGHKQVHTRSFLDRSANAFYEIGLVSGIELMYTEREMHAQIGGRVLLAISCM